jgi:monofunctional glycosyltransferase
VIEDDAGVSGEQQAVNGDGAASAETPVAPDRVGLVDVEALVQTAVRRIADSVTPVAVLQAARTVQPAKPDMRDVEEPVRATEHAAAVSGDVELEQAGQDPSEVGAAGGSQPNAPMADDFNSSVAIEPTTARVATEPERPAPAEHLYVPRSEDRILLSLERSAAQQRIEPTFEAASPKSADVGEPMPSVEAGTIPAETRAPVSGGAGREPWTWRRAVRLIGGVVAAYFGVVLFLILLYRFVNPPTTTLIAYQWLTGTTIEQEWVPIEDISSNLLRAVVVSEDWGFCDHYGVDLDAIEKALELAGEGKVARGASTISMQVIKNLFLSQSKSYVRKAVEIPLTFVAEAVWPKSRMLEIYLNIAEWGPGVFGAEAAAQHHFSKPASQLSQREAALLAAALPNPILRDAGDPGTRTARKASVIQARMRAAGPVADCAMTGRQRSSDAEDKPGPGWQTTVKKRAGAAGGL